MLWSDPDNEPPEELRDMQFMVWRAGVVLGVAMVVLMLVVGAR
ncbi:morphogenic membrane protein MmpB [Streptomyces sp. NPDC053431]